MKLLLLMFLALIVWAVDPGFTDISSSKIARMTYVWPEAIVSTGTNSIMIMLNPLRSGTSYWADANSKMVCNPSGTMTTTQGKYVHAQFFVNYWVSISSEIGK